VNVKRVETVSRGTDLVSLEARPSFRALGRRFGKATPEAAAAIAALGSAEVARFEAGEPVTVVVRGGTHVLGPDDLAVVRHARGDLVVESDGEVVAALDPALSPELVAEGLAREVVSRVQRMRKDAGYQVADRIRLWVDGGEAVRQAVERHAEYISGETLAIALATSAPDEAEVIQEVDLDGQQARIALRRAR
jgi:isoleucyl-tRNA synthetase